MTRPGKAARRGDGDLYWWPGRSLTRDERVMAQQAGFNRQAKENLWVAKRTPEREAFLLRFVDEVTRVDDSAPASPFTQYLEKPDGGDLPELLNLHFDQKERLLTLTILDDGQEYHEEIHLIRPRAGLSWIGEASGTVAFTHGLTVSPHALPSATRRLVPPILGIYRCRRGLAEALHFLFRGVEASFSDWPIQEGVQPAQDEAPVANAAD